MPTDEPPILTTRMRGPAFCGAVFAPPSLGLSGPCSGGLQWLPLFGSPPLGVCALHAQQVAEILRRETRDPGAPDDDGRPAED